MAVSSSLCDHSSSSLPLLFHWRSDRSSSAEPSFRLLHHPALQNLRSIIRLCFYCFCTGLDRYPSPHPQNAAPTTLHRALERLMYLQNRKILFTEGRIKDDELIIRLRYFAIISADTRNLQARSDQAHMHRSSPEASH